MTVDRCLIVPVHPPKCNWLIALLMSIRLRQSQTDSALLADRQPPFQIVLAVSGYGDFVFFERLLKALRLDRDIAFFVVDSYIFDTLQSPELLSRFQNNTDGCIVNLKKLLALQWAFAKGYTWAACIDTDVVAVSELDDLFEIAINNYRRDRYFGASGQTGLFSDVNKAVIGAFPEPDQSRLAEMLKAGSLYAWFFDLPLYNSVDFGDFLATMCQSSELTAAWLCTINHSMFEHLMFLAWRLMYRNCSIVDYLDIGIDKIPENLTSHDLIRISEKYGYFPCWMNALHLFMEPSVVGHQPHIRFAYHFDRMQQTRGA